MSLVEFYVAVNPPLSPSGAAEVREMLQALEITHKDTIHEVIYDPEIALFRFLTHPSVREMVNDFMESTLKEIGQQDTQLNDNQEQNSSNDGVETTAIDSRFTKWPLDDSTSKDPGYDALRLPKFSVEEGEAEPAFKASWHGVEKNWSMSNKEQFFDDTLPASLKRQFGVEITWNFRQSVLYIASTRSMDDVDKTIAALDKMIETEKARYQTRAEMEAKQQGQASTSYVEPVFW